MIKQWLCVKWASWCWLFPVVTLHRVVYLFYLTIRRLQADTGQLAWLYMTKDESEKELSRRREILFCGFEQNVSTSTG